MTNGDSEYEIQRKVLQLSDSLAVTLPHFWAKAHGVKHGDKVLWVFNNHDYLKLIPIPAEKQ
jgi:antitoxin component of MazEF toxin-antitoxin module